MTVRAQAQTSHPLHSAPKKRARVLGRVLHVLAPVWPLAVLTALVLVATTLLSLAGPAILRYAIDHGLRAGQPDLTVVRNASALFLASSVLALTLGRMHMLLTGVVGERFVRDMRRRVFAHLMRMSTGFYDRSPSGKLVSRLTSDIDALQDLVQQGLVQFIQSVLTLGVLAVVLTVLSWKLALVALVPIPGLVFGSRIFQRRSRKAYLLVREHVGQTLATLVESLAGIRVVQTFGREAARRERSLQENALHGEAGVAAAAVQGQYLPLIELTTVTSSVLSLAAGGWLVLHGHETLGTVSAFSMYLLLAAEPLFMLSVLFNTLQSAAAALEKLFEVLDQPHDLPEGARELRARGALSLEQVGFAYTSDGAPVLSDVSLTLAHGQRLAVVGPTGAGKSTLAKLMARLCDPTQGRVCYGEIDLRDAAPSSLRRRIVMVAQEGHVFDGTVADNLRAARPEASDAQLQQALRQIGAYDHFAALPLGLATEVGARGALLSAGERQLVALGRTALLDADVLIFDEATSSLDTGTELLVSRALETLMVDRTVIIIAHRLSTMRRLDRIAVVSERGIAELGTHAELIDRGGLYQALYRQWEQSGAFGDGRTASQHHCKSTSGVMQIPDLETPRLWLRGLTLAHAADVQKYFDDYEVIRFLARQVPWPYPANGAEQFIRDLVLPVQGDRRWTWGLFDKAQPAECIGIVDLWREPRPENRGFWLGRPFWGRGFMSEATEAVTMHAFLELGFDKLVFSHAHGNTRSRRVKEKSGARFVGLEPASFVDPRFTQREIWELDKQTWSRARVP